MNCLSVQRLTSARIPTEYGRFQLYLYRNNQDGLDQLAFVYGDIQNQESPLVRIHSECFTGDVLGSLRCDCGPQLQAALALISQQGSGILLYMRQEGRGIGLLDKLRAYNLQDEGFDTVDANLRLGHPVDARDYQTAALILRDLNIHSVALVTNNPAKIEGLQELGISVVRRIPLQVKVAVDGEAYMQTKVSRMQHLLSPEG